MFRAITMMLILALSGAGMGCFSHAKLQGEGYSYEGHMYESPTRTANARATILDAETRREIARGNISIQRIYATTAASRTALMNDCIREGNYECIEAINFANLNQFGYVGVNGWGFEGPLPHTQNDSDFIDE